jgi:hypothetical protein
MGVENMVTSNKKLQNWDGVSLFWLKLNEKHHYSLLRLCVYQQCLSLRDVLKSLKRAADKTLVAQVCNPS